MVSYGPWTQDPDYTTFRTISTADNPPAYTNPIGTGEGSTPFQDPVYPITVGDLTAVFGDAQTAVDNEGGWVEWLASTYDLSFPNWRSSWSSRIWARRFPIADKQHLYSPPNFGSLPPDGAIGVEYVGQPFDPDEPWAWGPATTLTFHLGPETKLEGQFEDNRVASAAPLPWGVETRLMITPPDEPKVQIASVESPANDTANNWLIRDLNESIDLAPYGALESGWTAVLHTETPTVIIGGDPGPYGDTYTRYGWLFKALRINNDLRPPLYRWVFESTAPTYRRNYPRDDGLAGGARRNYPPSKAVQSGNRTSGGYL